MPPLLRTSAHCHVQSSCAILDVSTTVGAVLCIVTNRFLPRSTGVFARLKHVLFRTTSRSISRAIMTSRSLLAVGAGNRSPRRTWTCARYPRSIHGTTSTPDVSQRSVRDVVAVRTLDGWRYPLCVRYRGYVVPYSCACVEVER